MGQVAYDASNGELIEAFSATDEQWAVISAAARGSMLMPGSAWPAVPKTSIRGLRFFAHHPRYPGPLPKPESYAHTRLKIDVVRTARELGYHAELEVPGSNPGGEEWVADVLVTKPNGERMAFEIQLSSQHLRDFRSRTERYQQSSVACCWLISDQPVGTRLARALVHENMEYYSQYGEHQADAEDLLLLCVPLEGKDTYPEERPFIRFSRGPQIRRMPMSEAIQGVLNGVPRWRRPSWYWGLPASPTTAD